MQNTLVPTVQRKSSFLKSPVSGHLIRLASLVGAAMLSACATTTPAPVAPTMNTSPGVHQLIMESVARVDRADALMQNSKEPADFTGNRMNVFWVGDAHDILAQIASARKMKFSVTGPTPRLDLPVDIKLVNVSAAEAIKKIGDKVGGKATVKHFDNEIVLQMNLY